MEYIVYVKTNKNSYITAVNSSEFLADITGWEEIDRGTGDRCHHAQGNYFSEPIEIADGVYRYKLVRGGNKKWRESTQEEIAAQEAALEPEQPEPSGSVWDELDAAYQRGVDSV